MKSTIHENRTQGNASAIHSIFFYRGVHRWRSYCMEYLMEYGYMINENLILFSNIPGCHSQLGLE